MLKNCPLCSKKYVYKFLQVSFKQPRLRSQSSIRRPTRVTPRLTSAVTNSPLVPVSRSAEGNPPQPSTSQTITSSSLYDNYISVVDSRSATYRPDDDEDLQLAILNSMEETRVITDER